MSEHQINNGTEESGIAERNFSVADTSTNTTLALPSLFGEDNSMHSEIGVEQGFVFLWRKLKDNPVYQNSNAVHILIELLFRAAIVDKQILHGKEIVHLKKGQCITGRFKLSEVTGLSDWKVREALTLLQKLEIIHQHSSNAFSIITICNYEAYQNKGEMIKAISTNTPPTNLQQVTTKKTLKTDKTVNIKSSFIFPYSWNNHSKVNATWNEWVEYRNKLGQVKDWSLFYQKQLDWLKQYNPDIAVEIINTSIRNGWRGLFELKGSVSASTPKPPTMWELGEKRKVIVKRIATGQCKPDELHSLQAKLAEIDKEITK